MLSALSQEACLQGNLIAICLEQLNDPHPLLRQWVAICLGRIWQNFDSARWCGVRDSAHEKLCSLLSDPIPEVSPPPPVCPGQLRPGCQPASPGAMCRGRVTWRGPETMPHSLAPGSLTPWWLTPCPVCCVAASPAPAALSGQVVPCRGWTPAAHSGLTATRPILQVRCAAVFALGTFVGNSAERTDHSTTIDHNVAMMLAQLINDGSPMVRKVRGPRSAGSRRVPRGRSPAAPGGLSQRP